MDQNSSKKAGLFLISFSMSISILIFVFVIFFMAHQHNWPMVFSIQADKQLLSFMIAVISLVDAVLLVFVPLLFGRSFDTKKESQKTIKVEDAYQKQVNGDSINRSLFLDYSGDITSGIQTMSVLRLALAEVIAVFGFVSAFLNQSAFVIIPFAAFALALQMIFGPLLSLIIQNKK